MISLVLAVALVAAAQFVGWWLLALVAFLFGLHLRGASWPALRVAGLVLAFGLVRLAWLATRGARLGEVGDAVGGIVGVPPLAVWAAAVLLPALVALTAAALGAALGRRVMFG